MRLSIRIILGLWLGILISLSALVYNAYTKFKPENFLNLIRQQIQRNYPTSKLSIAESDFKISLDLVLKLKKLRVEDSFNPLLMIEEVEFKLPWWLILFGQGSAQINLDQVVFYLREKNSHSSESSKIKSPDSLNFSLPGYLKEAHYTIRAKNMTIRDVKSGRRYFAFTKFLVRQLRYGKNSAFELLMPVSILTDQKRYHSQLWLFGDVTPTKKKWIVNYRGDFKAKETFEKNKLEDLVFSGTANYENSKHSLSSSFNLLMDKTNVGSGQLKLDQTQLDVGVKVQAFPMSFFQPFYSPIKNPYLPKLVGDASGDFRVSKRYDDNKLQANGKLVFPGSFSLTESDALPGTWKMSFTNNRWETSFMGPKGEASFFRRSYFEPTSQKLTQYNEEIGFTGLDFALVSKSLSSFSDLSKTSPDVFFSTKMTFSKTILGSRVLDGQFTYGHSPEAKFYVGELKDDQGMLSINFNDKGEKNLEVRATQFLFFSDLNLLSPFFNSNGVLNGAATLKWKDDPLLSQYNLNFDTNSYPEGFLGEMIKNFQMKSQIELSDIKNVKMNMSGSSGLSNVLIVLDSAQDKLSIKGPLNIKKDTTLIFNHLKEKRLKSFRFSVTPSDWLPKENIQ